MLINTPLIIQALIILLFALISPGPDFFMVLRNSLTFGKKAGFASALGIATGCLFSFTLVLLGLEILFKYPMIKASMSILCGLYLIYLGFLSLSSKARHKHVNYNQEQSAPFSVYFRNGLLTNILNPKLYTLCTAIMAFVEQKHPSVLTNIIIVIGQGIMTLIWFVFVSRIFSSAKVQNAYFKREVWINRLLGFVLIIVGSKVMFG